jgi:hypothetical protein
MSRTRRDQARGRGLGTPHHAIPHVYRKVPKSAAEALYPNLPSDQQVRDRDRQDRRTKEEKNQP